jgi:hypothetical protein
MSFQDEKDRIDQNYTIFNLCVKYELVGKQERHRRFIDDANQLVYTLNKEMSVTREMASRRKDSVKFKIKKKVPKLNKITNEFIAELEDIKYLDINSEMSEILIQIDKNVIVC